MQLSLYSLLCESASPPVMAELSSAATVKLPTVKVAMPCGERANCESSDGPSSGSARTPGGTGSAGGCACCGCAGGGCGCACCGCAGGGCGCACCGCAGGGCGAGCGGSGGFG